MAKFGLGRISRLRVGAKSPEMQIEQIGQIGPKCLKKEKKKSRSIISMSRFAPC